MTFRAYSLAAVLIGLSAAAASAAQQPTAPSFSGDQNGLVDRAIQREKVVIKMLKERTPLVETYIQNMRPDPVMRQVPESDAHFLGRVEFRNVINDQAFEPGPKPGAKKAKSNSSLKFVSSMVGSMHLEFNEAGFVQMILMDSNSFDREHYNFEFIRNDFLGSVSTAVFDVKPVNRHSVGRFFGRVWIDTKSGNVVRFNGDFSGSEKGYQEFYHFDSWRTNVAPDVWLPTSFYADEADPKSTTSTLKLQASGHVWGYALRSAATNAEQTSVEVADTVDVSQDTKDVSPRMAMRAFEQQAEDNIVGRLFSAGLLDAPSDYDRRLETLANNILVYNKLTLSGPLHVRTLLTEPLESLSIGNTIILSKSLIDTTAVVSPDGVQHDGNLNALLAFQLAHILSGHHMDTKFAFNDSVLFPDSATFRRIPMHHSDAENDEAAKKAIELLSVPELADSQRYFGLYLQQLQVSLSGLKALNEPLIGDALVKSDKDPSFWMAATMPKAERLDIKDLKQQGAERLSGFLNLDPWTDQVVASHTAFEPVLSPSDKLPFAVTPLFIKLNYFGAPADDKP